MFAKDIDGPTTGGAIKINPDVDLWRLKKHVRDGEDPFAMEPLPLEQQKALFDKPLAGVRGEKRVKQMIQDLLLTFTTTQSVPLREKIVMELASFMRTDASTVLVQLLYEEPDLSRCAQLCHVFSWQAGNQVSIYPFDKHRVEIVAKLLSDLEKSRVTPSRSQRARTLTIGSGSRASSPSSSPAPVNKNRTLSVSSEVAVAVNSKGASAKPPGSKLWYMEMIRRLFISYYFEFLSQSVQGKTLNLVHEFKQEQENWLQDNLSHIVHFVTDSAWQLIASRSVENCALSAFMLIQILIIQQANLRKIFKDKDINIWKCYRKVAWTAKFSHTRWALSELRIKVLTFQPVWLAYSASPTGYGINEDLVEDLTGNVPPAWRQVTLKSSEEIPFMSTHAYYFLENILNVRRKNLRTTIHFERLFISLLDFVLSFPPTAGYVDSNSNNSKNKQKKGKKKKGKKSKDAVQEEQKYEPTLANLSVSTRVLVALTNYMSEKGFLPYFGSELGVSKVAGRSRGGTPAPLLGESASGTKDAKIPKTKGSGGIRIPGLKRALSSSGGTSTNMRKSSAAPKPVATKSEKNEKEAVCSINYFSKLSSALVERIFSFLLYDDLCKVSGVCKSFKSTADKKSLWKPLYELLTSQTKNIHKFSGLAAIKAREMPPMPNQNEANEKDKEKDRKKQKQSKEKEKDSKKGQQPTTTATNTTEQTNASAEDMKGKGKKSMKQKTIEAILNERKTLGVAALRAILSWVSLSFQEAAKDEADNQASEQSSTLFYNSRTNLLLCVRLMLKDEAFYNLVAEDAAFYTEIIRICHKSTHLEENRIAWKIIHECLYHHDKTLRFLHDSPDGLLEKLFAMKKLGPQGYNNMSNFHCLQQLAKLMLMDEGLPSQKVVISSGKSDISKSWGETKAKRKHFSNAKNVDLLVRFFSTKREMVYTYYELFQQLADDKAGALFLEICSFLRLLSQYSHCSKLKKNMCKDERWVVVFGIVDELYTAKKLSKEVKKLPKKVPSTSSMTGPLSPRSVRPEVAAENSGKEEKKKEDDKNTNGNISNNSNINDKEGKENSGKEEKKKEDDKKKDKEEKKKEDDKKKDKEEKKKEKEEKKKEKEDKKREKEEEKKKEKEETNKKRGSKILLRKEKSQGSLPVEGTENVAPVEDMKEDDPRKKEKDKEDKKKEEDKKKDKEEKKKEKEEKKKEKEDKKREKEEGKKKEKEEKKKGGSRIRHRKKDKSSEALMPDSPKQQPVEEEPDTKE